MNIMDIKKGKMMQQDLRSVNAYALGVVSLAVALFIPVGFLALRIFRTQALFATLIVLGVGVPLVAIILGVLGFVKGLGQSNNLTKSTKIVSIISIIISIAVIAFDLYIFIKSGGFG